MSNKILKLLHENHLIPYLGLYNAQDFAQILFLVGGVRIINRNNVFHSLLKMKRDKWF